jgi:CheY-like chemotaxis protein
VSSVTSTLPRILCVDDRVSSLEVRRAVLTQAGYDVVLAGDPPSALVIIDEVKVDLAVLDYNFPGHISGEELAHELRMRKPNLPLIMLSGVPDLPDSAAESVDILILKGGDGPTELLQAIAGLLQGAKHSTDPSALNEQPAAAPQARGASAAGGSDDCTE